MEHIADTGSCWIREEECPVRVCVYYEYHPSLLPSGGIRTAYRNHMEALRLAGVEVVHRPREPHDLLHLHSTGPLSLLLLERTTGMRPVVVHAHTTAEDFANSFRLSDTVAPMLGRYLRYFYNRADLVIAPSSYTARILRQHGVRAPVEVVSNGVDVRRFLPDPRRRLRGRARYRLSGFVVFAVGLVLLRKGIELFCETARRVPEARFVWFGPIHKAVKSETLRVLERAPENVRFTGYVENVLEAYAAGDVFFFPSTVENEGIAVLEAAACGKPLLLRAADCFRDRFTHGGNCLMAEDPDTFATYIRQLRGDPELRERLAQQARAFAEQHRLEVVGARLRELYEGLLLKRTDVPRAAPVP
ncbi:MAG: glycosyltransferase [Armatimonadetes bacterium]|nr:glycosyltransferase [Armatimonadota bacterium]MDW8154139.1 glycosyltransferase [Armatimonadota bacterium]